MKLMFFYSLFFFGYLSLSSQTLLPFKINGKFISQPINGKIYLSYEIDGKGNLDSCKIINGLFNFSGKIPHPVFAILSTDNGRKSFFIEPKAITLVVEDDMLKKVNIFGSNNTRDYSYINNQIARIDNRWKTVFDTLDKISARSITQFQELKEWVLTPYFYEIRETYLDYFKTHSQSYVTAYLLSLNVIEMNQGVFPTDSLQKFYRRFKIPIKESWYGKKILEELSNRQIAVPGKRAFDFTQIDKDGQELSLQSFRGKYILLDFWGSWCLPCRKGHPHLKEIYNLYKDDNFNIIGVAKEYGSKDSWLMAIDKDGLPWRQVLCDSLDIKYNITSFPTKLLIDKEGMIIGRYGEETTELDKQLKAIFKKPN